MCTQHKRPMKSMILDPGMIDLVLNDAKDFLASKEWYAERGQSLVFQLRLWSSLTSVSPLGIPHRCGYLLYGAPGAGKTSLIHSIAGELNLDVYILSLTRMGMDDSTASRITHSGLLNALDVIGAHEGRILFPTTNK